MSVRDFLFLAMAAGTCVGAVLVVLTPTVARMALWLIVTLGSSAGLFFMLRADLSGVAQLLVYVGGTLVLLIFGAMLTTGGARGVLRTPRTEVLVTGVLSMGLLAVLVNTVLAAPWPVLKSPANTRWVERERDGTTLPIGLALLGIRPDRLGTSVPTVPGSRPGYLLPFELVSVHLLIVLVGAAYLARAKRRVPVPAPGDDTHATLVTGADPVIQPRLAPGTHADSASSESIGGSRANAVTAEDPATGKRATWPTT